MFEKFKPRMTYNIFGIASVAVGVIYAFLHWIWLRKLANPQRPEGEVPTIVLDGVEDTGERFLLTAGPQRCFSSNNFLYF